MSYPVPANEEERIEALRSYEIAATPPELAYDDIAELAAAICDCPVGLVNLIEDEDEWLKAKYGLPADLRSLPRGSICSTTLCQNSLLHVPDLAADDRFSDHASVTGAPGFQFYCGMPLINQDGYALGTVCVMDFKPREISDAQQLGIEQLARQTMAHLELRRQLIETGRVSAELAETHEQLQAEQRRSERLLHNILPIPIADELKTNKTVRPKYYALATVMFTDFEGFTHRAEETEPRALIETLDQFFRGFDDIVERHELEKIKTIGDSFMCVGGVPEENVTNPVEACLAALEITRFVERVNKERKKLGLAPWPVRVGLHTGPLIAGVVGKRKFAYDTWGSTVNVASRIESTGVAGGVCISHHTNERVKEFFETESRGTVRVKEEGKLDVYLLRRIRPEFSRDATGYLPNERFSAIL